MSEDSLTLKYTESRLTKKKSNNLLSAPNSDISLELLVLQKSFTYQNLQDIMSEN